MTSGPESHRDRKGEITIEEAKLPREEMTEGPKRVNLSGPSQRLKAPSTQLSNLNTDFACPSLQCLLPQGQA